MNVQQPRPYVDAHAHIQDARFADDRAAVLERARLAGVGAIVCASDDETSSRLAVALAEREPDVWATVGIHPHEAAMAGEHSGVWLADLAASKRVVAIGEIGLDYYRDLSPRPIQRGVFERQLDLASKLHLPVVIHSREAAEETYAILHAWRGAGIDAAAVPCGVMHCFGYDVAVAERFVELGFLISIPGTVTYPKAESIQQVAARIPLHALTVETDCPYLAPQSRRGQRNEPSYLGETVARIASLRGVEGAVVAEATTANARRLYGLPCRTEDAGKGAP